MSERMSTPAKRLTDHGIASFETLYSSELPVVFGFLRIRAAGDVALAEDLTALVFLSAVEQFQAGRGDVVTRNWLLTVAKRRLIDHWRRLEVAERKAPLLRPTTPAEDLSLSLSERELVERALAALTITDQAALTMSHLDGMSVPEIAEVLGRGKRATESTLRRARERFRVEYRRLTGD